MPCAAPKADFIVSPTIPMVSSEFKEFGNTGPLEDVLFYARATPVPQPRPPSQ